VNVRPTCRDTARRAHEGCPGALAPLMAAASKSATTWEHALPLCGYTLVTDAFTVDEAKATRDATRTLVRSRGQKIFNPDRKRSQVDLSSVELRREILVACKPVLTAVQTALTEHGCLVTQSPVLLHSASGCHAQPWHRDYAPEDTVGHCRTDDPKLTMACVAAIDSETTLDVVPRSHLSSRYDRDPNDAAVQLEISCGSLVLFHGALVHRGSEYEEENARVHMYGFGSGGVFAHNRTYVLVDEKGQRFV